ncbi:uncharacterized protein B0H18DRAFT_836204, partial [Fomitopsis serialis]|uniref:uncharacterized protein n=1 Tax=Fomitopsis serialis TaxID=139415 RepID=UPI002008DD6F
DRRDLYNCALVCRAWHHRSQALLYFRVFLADAEAYDSLARFAIQSPRSSRYLSSTRMLEIHSAYTASICPCSPLVLGRSMPHLQCLSLRNCLHPPYHDSFVTFMSQFTAVQHLWLDNFELKSFADFRRIICSLPRLRDLHLAG